MTAGRRGRVARAYFRVLNATLNPVTVRLARSGFGPLALIRHTGRRSGRTYETPIVLARDGRDFVAELTYGPGVDWYRNVVAAGGCVVVHGGTEHRIAGVEPYPAQAGLAAFGRPAALLLRLLRRREFRLLRTAATDAETPG
ncbi:nitroreductase/quinone reductase family protein [Couchioplanes caeruleus]|uniref:nitroreductase/quinone reductase family protein n=1 Tax=Couchioplanes caeruleus TaxID=56438 RepID=UPI00201BE593|nr:nitroreductase/quinone reductase family protein [Couchioplanes caeruleus]UQU61814.1 nitroreductase/quinone reductase family protein [Couchioplanes caeruleus]